MNNLTTKENVRVKVTGGVELEGFEVTLIASFDDGTSIVRTDFRCGECGSRYELVETEYLKFKEEDGQNKQES